MLISYMRDENGQKCGVVVAVLNSQGQIGIGYSACSHGDRFKRDHGLMMAEGRAKATRLIKHEKMPRLDIRWAVVDMVNRAKRYYKNCPISTRTAQLIEGLTD